ncbi:unnamed protein product [Ophioblennius macclurei]
MINTYQTSLAPPPVPPRDNRSQSILIPASLPSRGHSKALIRFLVGVVVVHLLLSLAAFVYLYLKYQTDKSGPFQGKGLMNSQTSGRLSETRELSTTISARMMIGRPATKPKTTSGRLEWDIKHSVLSNVGYYEKSWLTARQPGEYHVYSRVTFSKGDPVHPLVSQVLLRNETTKEEKVVMQAFCAMSGDWSISNSCTASQGQVVALKKGSQLSVWVHNLSLVDYSETSTTFGMYKIWDS